MEWGRKQEALSLAKQLKQLSTPEAEQAILACCRVDSMYSFRDKNGWADVIREILTGAKQKLCERTALNLLYFAATTNCEVKNLITLAEYINDTSTKYAFEIISELATQESFNPIVKALLFI